MKSISVHSSKTVLATAPQAAIRTSHGSRVRWRDACAMAAVVIASTPAYAQFEKATQLLTTVQTWLLSIGAVVVTIAIMFVGFRMMFQAAQWRDVAPVFWGGILVGGGSAIAGMFF